MQEPILQPDPILRALRQAACHLQPAVTWQRVLTPLRARAVLELIAGCGLKSCEVAALTVGDIDLAACSVTVAARVYAPARTLPLTRLAVDALDALMAELPDPPETRLFFESARVGFLVRRLSRQAGLEAGVTPETLRNAWMARQARAGVPLDRLQEAAGFRRASSPRRSIAIGRQLGRQG